MRIYVSLLLIAIFGLTFGQTKKKLKSDLDAAEKKIHELSSLLAEVSDTNKITINYPCDANRKDVKIAKQQEKTKRDLSEHNKQIEELKAELEKWKVKHESSLEKVRSKHQRKIELSDNKVEIKTDDTRLWTKLLKSWQLFLGIFIGASLCYGVKRLKSSIPFF